eukprot:TRINITY_DN70278_c0_g1_i1.p1 TRINITY_DN70278_c0_g1~~TRINITY_DN70278_c0_g1_i1.p1  ORF type:complete len:457 (+),score=69.05 TRINITY_DN70278_c0_g1_i1:105-1373(+)
MLAYCQPNLGTYPAVASRLPLVWFLVLYAQKVGASTAGRGGYGGHRNLHRDVGESTVDILPTGAIQRRKNVRSEEHHSSPLAVNMKESNMSRPPASLLELDFGGSGDDDVNPEEMQGVEESEEAFEVKKKQNVDSDNCMWVSWAMWSSCSVTCNSGVSARFRGKRGPFGNGMDCVGMNREVVNCNTEPCPVDCAFSQWASWGPCSVSCGGPNHPGRHTRTRHIATSQAHGGVGCTSSSKEDGVCNHREVDACPMNCEWAPWAAWGSCSLTCGSSGGISIRTRKLKQQARRGGSTCNNLPYETMVCNQRICPMDCSWFEWQEWTDCTRTCGIGEKLRVRDMKTKNNQFGVCPGSGVDTASCFVRHCPVDCTPGDWTEWGVCSAICGGGERSKTRTKKGPKHHGKPCDFELIWTETCNMKTCKN